MSTPAASEARLAHLGIIVRRLEAAEPLYRRLGLPTSRPESFDRESVRMAFVRVDEVQIELLEPVTPEGSLGRFLAARGEGIHHVALEVSDIDKALARARAAGMRPIDQAPRPGAHGTRIAFLHPATAYGVLLELVERPSSRKPPA